jgi:hypothetical protein
MSKPDTSRAAVQTLASHWHGEYIYDLLNALLDERDALQTKLRDASLDRLAANDAPLLDLEAAFAAGAEAMREQAVTACQRRLNARTYGSHENACEFCAEAIRALPTPKMEDKTND